MGRHCPLLNSCRDIIRIHRIKINSNQLFILCHSVFDVILNDVKILASFAALGITAHKIFFWERNNLNRFTTC